MVDISLDTRQFEKKMNEYLQYTKRGVSEALNQKAYFIARNAVGTTKAATKEEIESDLRAASKKYPRAPSAAILVNRERGMKGLPGLCGAKMIRAVERFIRKRQAHRNFLRSGWIPAIKKLEPLVEQKRGPSLASTVSSGRSALGPGKAYYGGVSPAKVSISPVVAIWNSINTKTNLAKVKNFLIEGLRKAIDMEIASMDVYIERKLKEAARKAGID
jgi:hypothetical protein